MVAHLNGHHLFSRELQDSREEQAAKVAAATMIQRLWRGRQNRAKEEFMNPEIHRADAIVQIKLQVAIVWFDEVWLDREAANSGKNSPSQRWRRAVFLVGRLRDQNHTLKDVAGIGVEDAKVKQLGSEHWLEMIDA